MTICVVCKKPIDDREVFTHPADNARMHQTCVEFYSVTAAADPAESVAVDGVACQQCGGAMYQTKRAEKNMSLQLLGVVLFIVGIALCFVVPPIGLIVGLLLMVVAARLGYSKRKVWLCDHCGYFFVRA